MTVLTPEKEPVVVAGRWSPRSSMAAWLLLCAAICIALRVPFLDVPLGIDEGGDAFVARAWGSTQGSMYGGSWLDRSPLLLVLYKIGVLGGDRGVRILGLVAAILLVAGTMAVAHHIGGPRAARITGIITAIMSSSVVLGAVFTDNELLATVPATFAILALVRSRGSELVTRWLFASGFLASCAFLIKQSFAEVYIAGAVFLLVGWLLRTRSPFRTSWVAWWVAGVSVPLLTTLAWFALSSVGIGAYLYAIAGFRIDSLALESHSAQTAGYMLIHLGLPILVVSGCLLPVPWAAAWLLARRSDPQLVLTLAVWLVLGFAAIAGGGNYFPHYFIQPIAALAVLCGCALAVSGRRLLSAATAAVFLVLAVGNVAVGSTLAALDPPQQRTLAVSQFLRDNSRPGDSLYVMYARANLLYYADMPTPYPYLWSTMVRTVPGAEDRLRAVLDSKSQAPTWLVEWQKPTVFGLDASGETRRLIGRHYIEAGTLCGIPILIRKDEANRSLRTRTPSPCATLNVPSDLGPVDSRTPSDSAEYLWQ